MNIRKLLIDRRHDPEPILGSDYSCSFPSQYIIEPGNICNLKCPFCVNGMERKDSHPNRGFLGLNEFKVLLNKISPYARRIYFYNWGEPFLNKNIHSMVRLAVDRGIETYISSNLSLTELNYKAIIESGLTSLVVSIDGACQETYGKYRVGGDYQLVLHNLAGLVEAKKRLNKATPNIYWQFLTNKFNEHDVEKAKETAKSLEVSIYFNKMTVLDESWEATALDASTVHEYFNGSDPTLYRGAERTLPLFLKDVVFHPDLLNLCKQIINMMTINWDGGVFPCCSVYNKGAVIGNLIDQSLDEVWNSETFKKCRKYIYNYGGDQEKSPVCGTMPCFANSDHPLVKNRRKLMQ